MFPITERYVRDEHIQSSNNAPVRIPEPLAAEIIAKQKKVLALAKAGVSGLVFPDILSLEKRLKEGSG